jgi:UPF0716 protein FxsA
MPILFLLLWPLVEIAGFAWIGGAIGVAPTLALVLASTACGFALLRRAGVRTAARLAQRLGTDDQALSVLAGGAWQMLAGLLLIVPGIFSSVAGLLLLLPPSRALLLSIIKIQLRRRTVFYGVSVDAHAGPDTKIIDGDYVELDPGRLDIPR